MRTMFILFCAVVSAVAAYFGHPLVHENSDATIVMVTVMTVFAGFLVAIITILGDPAMIPKGSWRIAESRHAALERVIIRHTSLFYVYLAAIGLLFAGVLIDKEPDAVVSPNVKLWVESLYLFFGSFSFLLTLSLPRILGKIQLARSEAEIEVRRTEEGIKPNAESQGGQN